MCLFLRHAKQRKEGGRPRLYPSFVFHALEVDTRFLNPALASGIDEAFHNVKVVLEALKENNFTFNLT